MKLTPLATAIALLGLTTAAMAQAPQRVEITGSSIKRIQDEGALPIQIIRADDLARAGIVTAEQVITSLTYNGNGVDNMASQSDVVSGDSRGNNGATFANLRGQGARNTLILLNGRRVAAHGLNGTAVNLNTIPMAAVDRIEILKDGASAIYGTDAIGGVINFILKKNVTGVVAETFADVTQHAGGEVYRVSATGGIGNLDSDGFNAMFAIGRTENKALRGTQRDFVNTFQPDRGLSVDTRGTPTATVFARAGLTTILSPSSSGVRKPGDTQIYNGINPLALPGGAGCAAMPNSQAYDSVLWAAPGTNFGCAWDTGVSATLQQPVENTSAVARFTKRLGEHELVAEYVGAKVHSSKSFSEVQLISSTTNRYLYPSTGSSYNEVFNAIAKVFPVIEANRGNPIAFRWRCLDCGPRQIETDTESGRFFVGLDGPLPWAGWDYKGGISSSYSKDSSVLGGGYYFRDGMVKAIGSGVVNPFLAPGASQTDAGKAALADISARGIGLYNGKFTVTQADASATGPVFKLPAGDVMAAAGVDIRKEKFSFSAVDGAPNGAVVIAAPFDGSNQLDGKTRDVKAVYAEVLFPVIKNLDLTAAVRSDDYTGFGRTTNPKVSFRFAPVKTVVMRGSYNEGFRVPTFNQIFNGITQSPYDGKDLVDPAKCASLKVNPADPNCVAVFPDLVSGGNLTLGPEKSKQGSLGLVLAPLDNVAVGVDWWSIERTNAIRTPSLSELMANYATFQSRFIRNAAGAVTAVDLRWFNAGGQKSQGVDLSVTANGKALGGRWLASLDGSYLIEKKSRIKDADAWGPSELGKFNRYDDPGIRWKHVAAVTYEQGPWGGTFTQRYTGGYQDAVLPGVANGSVKPANWNPRVKPYVTYELSATYKGIKGLALTAGVKNLFDKDPPFSAYYDADLGSGSSWDPRVADPRGRSFTLRAEYRFF